MKPSLFVLLYLLLTGAGVARAQGKYMTKTGQVSFFSASIIEDIEARNQQMAAVIDFTTSQLAFSVPIKAFVFKRTLMQEHFNENYMESDKFPKASFSGKFVALDATTLNTPGSHQVQVEGDLTIHGVTHHIQVPTILELKGSQLVAAATFTVETADYNIEIPALVRNNIAKVISIRVALACDPVTGTAAAPRTTN
jgi:hypothetical protein